MTLDSDKASDYGSAIREGFDFLLTNYPEVFVIGQGLWSPWYVGNSMTDLDIKFGKDRILDTPVSESACTGLAVGSSIAGMRPIVVHPRMDFLLYGMDAVVNQAAKWSYMFGGQASAGFTLRTIINRGGEQGAQHSQALHSWLAHIPGLRVVMPSTPRDARDLLIASTLCDDPVVYIDDRWLYSKTEELGAVSENKLSSVGPRVTRIGRDVTLVGAGYSSSLCSLAAYELDKIGISSEVIDLRVLNPFNPEEVIKSVEHTRRLLVVDGGWGNCGFAGEVLASVVERVSIGTFKSPPKRLQLPNAPAPAASSLEKKYYPNLHDVIRVASELI